jgi:hypothetical protein
MSVKDNYQLSEAEASKMSKVSRESKKSQDRNNSPTHSHIMYLSQVMN